MGRRWRCVWLGRGAGAIVFVLIIGSSFLWTPAITVRGFGCGLFYPPSGWTRRGMGRARSVGRLCGRWQAGPYYISFISHLYPPRIWLLFCVLFRLCSLPFLLPLCLHLGIYYLTSPSRPNPPYHHSFYPHLPQARRFGMVSPTGFFWFWE
ncbi:hypothetical protein N657DRAFT_300121 [Parathielavia appendiculata]|uniref:Uncharacterized protein n=1 Tax=Parathielavia appendiculata TaxID=2587402 RepID=A0AAN6U4C9_9PEZI|nr:hypothetical protein N657DRAFT_300121 [Parathielavia appendiculata]